MADYNGFTGEELIQTLKTGDESAFTEIYNRYWDKLIAVGYYFTRDKQSAEDIVHDVMMNLWRRKNDLQIHSLTTYLGTAVKFAVFKSIAKQKRQKEILNGIRISGTISDIEDKLDTKFAEEYIAGSLEELPEKTRLVFHYSRNEELPVKEIADKMNMSGKSVEYHLTKALKSIRSTILKIKLIFV